MSYDNQGLLDPLSITPHLVALQSDANAAIRAEALKQVHAYLYILSYTFILQPFKFVCAYKEKQDSSISKVFIGN
jgi:Sister chromatid cohesion C-terminus